MGITDIHESAARGFSSAAAAYEWGRPGYPNTAVEAIVTAFSIGPASAVVDLAAGTGKLTRMLVPTGARIIAVEPVPEMSAFIEAVLRDVEVIEGTAEAIPLDDGVADVVTVAQALHWFDREAFFAEAARVLRPGGLLAVWTYGLFECTPAVDCVVARYHDGVLGPYWSPARRLVDEGYASIAFPLRPVEAPPFAMAAEWTLERVVGYLATWSARQACLQATGEDPLPPVRDALAAAWGDPARLRTLRWPLAVHVRRKPA